MTSGQARLIMILSVTQYSGSAVEAAIPISLLTRKFMKTSSRLFSFGGALILCQSVGAILGYPRAIYHCVRSLKLHVPAPKSHYYVHTVFKISKILNLGMSRVLFYCILVELPIQQIWDPIVPKPIDPQRPRRKIFVAA